MLYSEALDGEPKVRLYVSSNKRTVTEKLIDGR